MPLLIIPGGGLDKTHPFSATKEFSNQFRRVVADLRNANGGQSTGPLDIERTWDAFTDDHVGLMDHLGAKKFMVLGYCIGQPQIWNLIKRAGDRVVAAVLTQPSGFRPELPTQFYDNNMKSWGPEFAKKRPEYTMEQVGDFLTNMYTKKADFVFTVPRDFVKGCKTPILVAPDDSPPPYKVAMEVAMLSPNAQVTLYP